MRKLKSIKLCGFKSFDSEGQSMEFGDITVLIGANGSGKSNFISFFKMLDSMMTDTLQIYVGENGYASSLLHYGPKVTDKIEANIIFRDEHDQEANYQFSLGHASGDILIFTKETVGCYNKFDNTINAVTTSFLDFAGHRESALHKAVDAYGPRKETALLKDKEWNKEYTERFIYSLLSNCRVFQFHDTSSVAKIRGQGYKSDISYLHKDAGNLAAFLYAMANNIDTKKYYDRIVGRIQAVFPQFRDFRIEPSKLNEKYIELNWLEKDSDYTFGPHQLSDGTLRFMALATLFLQPPAWLPKVIIVDEPELGLHPTAIVDLSSMVKQAAQNAQVILATQSPMLVDEFDAGQIVVVERDYMKRQSFFKKPDESLLADWLDRYSLGELWEKNVLGGKP